MSKNVSKKADCRISEADVSEAHEALMLKYLREILSEGKQEN